MKMTIDELKAAWNAQADAMNQWDELGIDEIVDFAQEQMREACAKVCDEKAQCLLRLSESPLMTDAGKELHYTMHVASMNCAAAIRAR